MNFDFLKDLKLDDYYKVLIVIGAVVFFGSLVIELKGINNQQGLLLGGALISIGLGEWRNHRTEYKYKPPNAYSGGTMYFEVKYWFPSLIGIILDGLGGYLIYLFVKSL